jgi:uncharacterized coiled-coil protein SlyX
MRSLAFLGLAGFLATAPLGAAEIDPEDFNQLKARVAAQDESIETFRATLQQIRQEMARLRADNDSIRTELSGTKNLATQQQFKELADQVREVDRNRTKDKQQILEAIEKLKSLPPVVIPEPSKPAAKPIEKPLEKPQEKPSAKPAEKPSAELGAKPEKPADAGPELPTEYYEHKVDEGETLGAIIEAYNKQHGLKVRLAHVLKANPALKDPKRLRVGQTIRIPAVK